MEEGETSPDFRKLWAKTDPYHPLWKHLLDAAAVSLALRNPLEKDHWTKEQVALIVGLHDVGKADALFQHPARLANGRYEQLLVDHKKWLDQDQNQRLPRWRWPNDVDRRYRNIMAHRASEIALNAGFKRTCDAPCRHERLSAYFLNHDAGLKSSLRVADTVQRAILAHHGHWDEPGRGPGDMYLTTQKRLHDLLSEVLNTHNASLPDLENHSAAGMRLAGHIVLCDWIASNEEFFTDSRLSGIEEPAEYFAKAKVIASDWVSKLKLSRGRANGRPEEIVSEPRPIQKTILDAEIPPSLVIIEAPMGEGKTEAAWILAEKWRKLGYDGMYMALPTMATSDSLYGRYLKDYVGKLHPGETAHLVHGMAWLRDDLEPENEPETGELGDDRSLAAAWFRPTRRAMLAQHGVGTVDQAMLSGMHVKFGFLRLYGLDGKVLVIDEVHAYDAYMNAIICRLLEWCACLRIPVILLSATLSANQRTQMLEAYGATGGCPGPEAPYPLVTVGETGKSVQPLKAQAAASRTLLFKTHPGYLGDAAKTADLAKGLVKDGGCCCVILNTVKQAQKVYRSLGDGIPKLLFHARFTAADRERITGCVLKLFGKDTTNRPPKFILVATQVVEQSLDVDFDFMISEIAPMDLLLQRSGRLHRHRVRKDPPTMHVLVPQNGANEGFKFGASEVIYERYPLLRTLKELADKVEVRLPFSFRPLVEAIYGEDCPIDTDNDISSSRVKWDDLKEDMAAQAGEFLLCEPMNEEFDPVGHDEVGDESDDGNGWRARTRLGLEDVLVIPLSCRQIKRWSDGKLHPRLIKNLFMRSVKIPPYFWPPKAGKGLPEPELGKGKLRGVWLLPVRKLSDEWEWKGLKRDGKDYVIKYSPKIGLEHGGD